MDIINDQSKFQFTITLVLVLFFSVVGFTYAYFAVSVSNNETINGSAATVNLTLEVNKIFPVNNNNSMVMVPQLSTSGDANSLLGVALKSGCVDANSNVVCQVYEVVIQNLGGTATQVVDGSVSFYGNAGMTIDIASVMPNLKWRLVNSVNKSTPNNSVLGTGQDFTAVTTGDVFVNDLVLETNDRNVSYIIIWINETSEDQTIDEGNSFYGRIEFNSSNGTGVTSMFSP